MVLLQAFFQELQKNVRKTVLILLLWLQKGAVAVVVIYLLHPHELAYFDDSDLQSFDQEQRRKRMEKSIYVVVMTPRVEGASSLTGEKGPKVAIIIILILTCASLVFTLFLTR